MRETKRAFAEKSDAIYVLSDGLPSVGEVTNPRDIRKRVKGWNRKRRTKTTIHCIAVGGPQSPLE